MNSFNSKDLPPLEQLLGVKFKNHRWLERALTHRSWLNEHRGQSVMSNERLEFLGDAVLEIWSSDRLFNKYPHYPEGRLTNIRSALVCTQSLAEAAVNLQLGRYLRLSLGEQKTGGRENMSLLENTFEAILGAIYSDQGIGATFHFLDRHLLAKLNILATSKNIKDAKTVLQEKAQKIIKLTPRYRLLSSRGPEHDKVFISAVFLGKRLTARGEGKSKRQAEEAAAAKALTILKKQSKIKATKGIKNAKN